MCMVAKHPLGKVPLGLALAGACWAPKHHCALLQSLHRDAIHFVRQVGLHQQGATNVLGDLTGSDNSTFDPKIATQEITVRLSMNFVATGGTLSITDEDNDIITSGGQINFSA